MRPEESFTPDARFRCDSKRSPAMPLAASVVPTTARATGSRIGSHQPPSRGERNRSGDDPADRSFHRLARAHRGRELPPAEKTAAVVLSRVACHDGRNQKQQHLAARVYGERGQRSQGKAEIEQGKRSGPGSRQRRRSTRPGEHRDRYQETACHRDQPKGVGRQGHRRGRRKGGSPAGKPGEGDPGRFRETGVLDERQYQHTAGKRKQGNGWQQPDSAHDHGRQRHAAEDSGHA